MAKNNVPAESKDAVVAAAAAPVEEPKTEAKKEPAKRGRKPSAEKKAAAEKKPAAKKSAAAEDTSKTVSVSAPAAEEAKKAPAKRGRKPAAEKAAKTENKPAAKKEAAPKASAKKPAAKKAAAKKDEVPKRAGRKKLLAYEDVVLEVRKKANAANVTKIKYPIAANVVLSGNFSENKNAGDDNKNVFYIVINPDTESISVEPYKYNDYDVEITADAEELMNVVKAKKNIYDALSDGEIHIHGTTKKAVLLIHAVF